MPVLQFPHLAVENNYSSSGSRNYQKIQASGVGFFLPTSEATDGESLKMRINKG